MVATSPPFYGLRRYPVPDTAWPDVRFKPMAGLPPLDVPAWTGQLGLEATPEAFTGHLVHVFRGVWRVLRDDGTAWVNLGSSFVGNNNTSKGGNADGLFSRPGMKEMGHRPKTQKKITGLRPKNDLMIPHRVAFALQADGWIVRSCIVWAKGVSFCPSWSGSVMPGSQQDRPTSAYEMVFLLSKNERYYYDNEAVKEKLATTPHSPGNKVGPRLSASNGHAEQSNRIWNPSGRTPRNVWGIGTKGTQDAHYAGWPLALVAPMIKAGTSKHGVCSACGASFERVVERKADGYNTRKAAAQALRSRGAVSGGTERVTLGLTDGVSTKTIGWQPACTCDAEPVPATVLDPFSGRGSTGKAAKRLGRRYVGIEAAEEYIRLHDQNLQQNELF